MLLDRYKDKVKTVEQLKVLLAPPVQVVLCHGVFDIVHPGHLRHLIYAKGLGDVLVASLTSDRFIGKGTYRPHVPQELRALNLAALEMVDYVLINDAARPDALINELQPAVYAKGFEYRPDARSLTEAALVEAYGGKVVYTPGDYVNSSTALLNSHLPDLRREKLEIAMKRAEVSFDGLRSALSRMAGKSVHVVGDTIIDSYTYCSMIGGQTKTPTISARFERQVDYVGGAAVVAKHLRAAGAEVSFTTVLGDDKYGELALNDLRDSGVKVMPLVEAGRPTTHKNAIVVGGYRLLKVDTLDNRPVTDKTSSAIAEELAGWPDAVVFSDFRHGIFNGRTIPLLTGAIPTGVYKVADSQVASRWGNILEFQGFDLITPNEREARFSLGDQDSGIRPLASRLYDEAHCKMLLLKLGERGVLTCSGPNHEANDSFLVLDSFAEKVVDAVGAGDALLAYATLGMLVTSNPVVATILGSFAAAAECEVEGNVPVTPGVVQAKIDQLEEN